MAPSIRKRLLVSLTLFIILALGLSGYALDHAFRHSAETALVEKLKAHFYSLLAASDDDNGKLVMPEQLSDPLFNQLDSGLYAIISTAEQQETWRSPSAVSLNIPTLPKTDTGQFRLQHLNAGGPVLMLSYGIIWEPEEGIERHYQVYVLQSTQTLLSEIAEFRASLWRWFCGIAILLIALQGIIMHWALAPLRRLAKEIQAIEGGQKEQLSDRYPAELTTVTHNLNVLIKNERHQRQRYRDTLADLAHSLKTPLAILRGLTLKSGNREEDQQSLSEQLARMDEIVSHQLQRASAKTGRSNPLSIPPVRLKPLADKLLRTLSKVYADKAVETVNNIADNFNYRADERDLLEVLGNLLDNAFKACNRHVSITAQSDQRQLVISINDDGGGIPEAQLSQVLGRGNRADTRHPGQGLGLTVAQDIIQSYHGKLTLGRSRLGGAQVQVELPLT
jgi:two-component system sensor histidine kinase PhoQ